MSDEELIDGIYKLVMCIATGGSSQVWECVEQSSGRHLAMKLLKQDVEKDVFKQNKAALKHEADVLKTLEHPMIVKYEKYSSNRDNTFLIMEHFRAPNVKLQLKSDIRSVHVRARKLFESVCSALAHVHSKGWIHRDLKPDNVLMNKVGEIRLVDYSLSIKDVKGFAKMMGGAVIKTIQGTRTYIAPETIRKQALSFQTDFYSLGILFFEVLTGRTPFQAPTPEELLKRHLRDEPPFPSEFNKNVTPEMDRLVLKLLKKKATDRPASADEILSELKRIRIFKEDVAEVNQQEEEEKSKSMDNLTELRLDSRADAKLSVMLQANPELARQFAAEKQAKSDKKKAEAALQAQKSKDSKEAEKAKKAKGGKGAQPAPQMMPPQMMPMMPQPMMPMMPPQMMSMPMAPQPMMPQPMMPPGFGQFPQAPQFPQMPPFGAQAPMGVPGAAFTPATPPPNAFPTGMPSGFPPQGGFPSPIAPPSAPPFTGVPANPAPTQPQSPPQVAAKPANRPALSKTPVAITIPTNIPPKPQSAASSRPPAPAKPAPPPKPAINPDDMDYMTELPDVL